MALLLSAMPPNSISNSSGVRGELSPLLRLRPPCENLSLANAAELHNVIFFLTSQFITLITVLKSYVMMLDLWISTDSYLFVYLCQNSYR